MSERLNVTINRGDDGQSIAFTYSGMAVDVSAARLYVRKKVDGTLLVKVTLADDVGQWSITDGAGSVTLVSADTEGVTPGRWTYDIELTIDSVVTTVQRGAFDLVGDIATDIAGDSIDPLEYAVSADEHVALDGAASPSASNVFATMDDLTSVTRVTTTYTILVGDRIVFCNTDGGEYTVTLPPGAGEQRLQRIVNTGNSDNKLTIEPNGAEELLGSNASVTLFDGEALTIRYDGTDGWY